jgi:hypothetical protein
MWHRRAEDGSPAGYTADIAEAGIFEVSVAALYHDNHDDRAVPVSEAANGLRRRLDALDTQRVSLAATIQQLEAA